MQIIRINKINKKIIKMMIIILPMNQDNSKIKTKNKITIKKMMKKHKIKYNQIIINKFHFGNKKQHNKIKNNKKNKKNITLSKIKFDNFD